MFFYKKKHEKIFQIVATLCKFGLSISNDYELKFIPLESSVSSSNNKVKSGVNWKIDAADSVIKMDCITTSIYCPSYTIAMMNRTKIQSDNILDHKITSLMQHVEFYGSDNSLLKMS